MSFMMESKVLNLDAFSLPSDKDIGFINAPCVDGLDTKSQHTNSKSGCTSKVPSLVWLTEPVPR